MMMTELLTHTYTHTYTHQLDDTLGQYLLIIGAFLASVNFNNNVSQQWYSIYSFC